MKRILSPWTREARVKPESGGVPEAWHLACNVAFLIELDREREVSGGICEQIEIAEGV